MLRGRAGAALASQRSGQNVWITPSEELERVQRRLLWQAHLMSSFLYSGLLEHCAADMTAGGPAARIMSGHGADPPDSHLGLWLMAAVHRLVLDGRPPSLLPTTHQ